MKFAQKKKSGLLSPIILMQEKFEVQRFTKHPSDMASTRSFIHLWSSEMINKNNFGRKWTLKWWWWSCSSFCELYSVPWSSLMSFLYFSPDISPPPACGVLYPSFDRNRFQAYLTKPMYPSQTHAKSKYCVGQAAVEDCLSYPSPNSFKASPGRINQDPRKQRKGGSPRVICTGIKKLSEYDGRETFKKTSDEVILKVDLCSDSSVDDRVCTSRFDQAHASTDDQNTADQARVNLSQFPTAYPGYFVLRRETRTGRKSWRMGETMGHCRSRGTEVRRSRLGVKHHGGWRNSGRSEV